MADPAHRLTDLYSAAIDATDAQASGFSKPAVPLLSASDFGRVVRSPIGSGMNRRYKQQSLRAGQVQIHANAGMEHFARSS
jgi:hypothetical protein